MRTTVIKLLDIFSNEWGYVKQQNTSFKVFCVQNPYKIKWLLEEGASMSDIEDAYEAFMKNK